MNANELKERRTYHGMTQSQCADTLGIGLRHYQKLEAGTATLTPTMVKLVRLLM